MGKIIEYGSKSSRPTEKRTSYYWVSILKRGAIIMLWISGYKCQLGPYNQLFPKYFGVLIFTVGVGLRGKSLLCVLARMLQGFFLPGT